MECRTELDAFKEFFMEKEVSTSSIESKKIFYSCLFSKSSGTALGYGLDDRGSSPGRDREFFPHHRVRQVLRPTQPPIQWVPGSPSLEKKQPGLEADHSLPSSTEFKNTLSYISTPPIPLHGVALR
jgi:hypothetical protein